MTRTDMGLIVQKRSHTFELCTECRMQRSTEKLMHDLIPTELAQAWLVGHLVTRHDLGQTSAPEAWSRVQCVLLLQNLRQTAGPANGRPAAHSSKASEADCP